MDQLQGNETASCFSIEARDTGLARAFRKTCAIRFSKNEDSLALSTRKKRTGNLAAVLVLSQTILRSGLYSLQRAQYRQPEMLCQLERHDYHSVLQGNRLRLSQGLRKAAPPPPLSRRRTFRGERSPRDSKLTRLALAAVARSTLKRSAGVVENLCHHEVASDTRRGLNSRHRRVGSAKSPRVLGSPSMRAGALRRLNRCRRTRRPPDSGPSFGPARSDRTGHISRSATVRRVARRIHRPGTTAPSAVSSATFHILATPCAAPRLARARVLDPIPEPNLDFAALRKPS